MRIAYIDVFFGISGDMMLGALVDAGVDPVCLRDEIQKIGIAGWDIKFEAVRVHGLGATRATVIATETGAKAHETVPGFMPKDDVHNGGHHEHSTNLQHQKHAHEHGDTRDHATHSRETQTEACRRHHHHHGRTPSELIGIIEASALSPKIRTRTIEVIQRLAEAEAEAHSVSLDEVHFHELGGVDTIIDIAGTLIGLDLLGIERVYASPIPIGHGFVDTAHGRLAVPVPAVVNLLRGCPTRPIDVDGETVTPTGAAIAAVVADERGQIPPMQLEAVGYGAGQKDFSEGANLVRIFVGDVGTPEAPTYASDQRILLEANIDDMTPELLADAREAIFEAGAVDCWFTPIYMKKSRPGIQLSALVEQVHVEAVVDVIFTHTTTFGVRQVVVARQLLEREILKVETCYGQVCVKIGRSGGKIVTISPEFEDCAALAREHSVATKQVYNAALSAANCNMVGNI